VVTAAHCASLFFLNPPLGCNPVKTEKYKSVPLVGPIKTFKNAQFETRYILKYYFRGFSMKKPRTFLCAQKTIFLHFNNFGAG